MGFVPKGIIPATVTPFDNQGNVSKSGFRRLVDYLLQGKVHGLFVGGSQGEFYALDEEEKRESFEVVVERVDGRVPVYAGTGAITTKETVRLTKMAESIGVDAVSVLTPFFIKPSQKELFNHYSQIALSTGLPLLLYSNPQRTGVHLSPELIVKLADVENIVGIKDSSGDITLTAEYIRRTDNNFAVLAGKDTLVYATLAYGGKGAIAATANVVPGLVVEIYEDFMRGQFDDALKAQYRLAPLRIAFELGSFPCVIKEALAMVGIDVGNTRSPVEGLQQEARVSLKAILDKIIDGDSTVNLNMRGDDGE